MCRLLFLFRPVIFRIGRAITSNMPSLVVGIEDQAVHVMDPALNTGPTPVEEKAFMLAWSGMDYYYATLTTE